MRLRGLVTLKHRKEFVHVRSAGLSASCGGLVLQAVRAFSPSPDAIEVGFTVSKKSGNSVTRNKIRRRMRVAAQDILPERANKDFCYVLVSSSRLADATLQTLKSNLVVCLKRLRLHL
ncbi:ribonuclease P protein component [Anaplasma bovis]|uniref:ribonuclease P protein component n=1 Tax=Anaplasma bovis TaxID=186733 RepID=UPI002FEF89CC